jgi:thiol-disulfide isomerase/thioredoxin
MNKLFLSLYLTAMAICTYGQHATRQGLQIGDTIPNVYFAESINGNLTAKSLADLRGRLTLLDFWETGCLGCIYGMPVLDTLQQAFGDKIQTIIICKSEKKDVERIFKVIKRPYPKTPIVVKDSILNRYFPHMTVPHHVWVDGNGVVKFITYDYNATVENVRKMLNGEPLHLSFRKQITDFDNGVLLYNEGEGRWNKEIKYHTLFAGYLDGVEHILPLVTYDSVSNSQMLKVINYPYWYLFQVAYNCTLMEGLYWQKSRWVLETKDTVNLKSDFEVDSLIDKWNRASVASYEAVMPGNNPLQLFNAMQRDLNIYSPYNAQIEKRTMKCLIITDRGIKPSHYKGKDSVFVTDADGSWVAKNYSIANTVYMGLVARNYTSGIPIIDETNFKGKVDLKIGATLGNLQDPAEFQRTQKELLTNGVGLEYGYRNIDMLVIRDKN